MKSRLTKAIPRGIRNNNPLNIRIGNTWLGEKSVNTDGEFEQFISMAYGLRAGFVLLRRYIMHYKLDTIEDIISRWAPRSENDTAAYVQTVCKTSGLKPDVRLKYQDKPAMVALVDGMIRVECGQPLANLKNIGVAYDMA